MGRQIKEVYVIHHSHTDVGYTDLQEQIIYNQANNIRNVVALIKKGYEENKENLQKLQDNDMGMVSFIIG